MPGHVRRNRLRLRLRCLSQARLLELLGRLLELPTNLDYLLTCGELLPAFVAATRTALDHCNSLDAHEPAMMTGGAAASRLTTLLQVGGEGGSSGDMTGSSGDGLSGTGRRQQ